MNGQFVPYFDYKIFGGCLSTITLDNRLVINTINQYSFCVAEHDIDFKRALLESDILLPDGIGVVWSNLFLTQKKVKKIAGSDLHLYLLEKINKEGGKCFYLGSSEEVLEKIGNRLSVEYPNIQFSSFSPAFTSEFSEEDSTEMIAKINEFCPDVLFVGMTAPKQEKWVNSHKHLLKANVISSIGAVFDFYAGTMQRPSSIWINLGLEWFGRFLTEPKRMWKRYFYFGPIFFLKVLSKKLD